MTNRNADAEVIMICMYIYIKVNMNSFRRPVSGPEVSMRVRLPDF